MISDRLNKIQNVISRFRIELYCFLYFLATNMINSPTKQLMFDKICLNNYRLAVDSCDSLRDDIDGQSKVNNQIQSIITQLTLYQHSLLSLPSIILTFLLGHWIDTRLDHLRYILALPCIGGAMLNIFLTVQCINFNAEPLDSIYPFLLSGISGGETLVITGAYAFICKTTQSQYRPLRFIILEAVSSLAIPLANFSSEKLLSQTPWIYGQYRNYIGVFLVSGCILTFTEFWILITLLTGQSNGSTSAGQSRHQSRKSSQVSAYSYYKSLRDANARRVTAFSLQVPGPSNRRGSSISHVSGGARRTSVATLLMGFSMMNKQSSPTSGQRYSLGTLSEDGLDIRRASAMSANDKRNSTFSADFTFYQVVHYQNAVAACKSFIRPRSNHGRSQLIFLTLSMLLVFFTINSCSVIDADYIKQLFNWTRTHRTLLTDVKTILISLISVIIMTIMVHLLSYRDLTITTIGLFSIFLSLLFKGLSITPITFYLSSTIEILFGLTLAGFRSMVTSIVYNYEIAKIFTIIASIMTLTRPLVILIFTKLPLQSTKQSNYLFLYCCLPLILPLVTIIAIYFIKKRQTNKQNQRRKSLCTVQITPSPLPDPTINIFELSIPKENARRKSNRF